MTEQTRAAGTTATGASEHRNRVNSDVARGIADGFSEASRAFSEEVAESASFSGLAESLVAGVLRANSRFLDEMAQASRRVVQGVGGTAPELDRLADLVADRLASTSAMTTPVIDYERLADLVAARLRTTERPSG